MSRFATYDAVVSLLQDLELIFTSHNHVFGSEQYCSCPFKKEVIQILYDNVKLMDSLLADSLVKGYDEKLTSIWYKNAHCNVMRAQNYINSAVRRCRTGADGAGKALTTNPEFRSIAESIDLMNKWWLHVMHHDKEVLHKSTQKLQGTTSTGVAFPVQKISRITLNERGELVGLEKDLLTMLDLITGQPSKLKVFALTGMGGIGKTTFAKRLYDDPLVMHHFYIRAWITISQRYQVREVLIGLLRGVTDLVTEINERCNEKLKEQLYKSLKGKRYLVVLDDMWDKQAWDDLKRIFPDDKNGSRIMLTSRLRDVAIHASPDTPPHCLRCLSTDESWELLISKTFGKESCPLELVPIGKQISCKCQGLPLAIVVIGGLLSKMNKTMEVWNEVARSVSSVIMEKPDQCQNILALSYNHLPDHLKSCFLYMGVFPEDYEIPARKLIWLWIGEGFIRSGKLTCFEELAEDYLEDLIARSLILVKRKRSNGRIKSCYIHDLLRDLCLRESEKQNFFKIFKDFGGLPKRKQVSFPWMERRLCFHSNIPNSVFGFQFSHIRSLLLFKTVKLINLESYVFMNFKLLRVLDIEHLHLEELPRDILGLAHLRHLALTFLNSCDRTVFSSTLYNLQSLMIDGEWNGMLPQEFWDMSELRHLQLNGSFSSYWPHDSRPDILDLSSISEGQQTFIRQAQHAEHRLRVMQNIQSLATIRPISCTTDIFLSMPNLKKLGVYENEDDCQFRGWFKYLIHLQELQILNYVFSNPFVSPLLAPDRLPTFEFFPPTLVKLTLSGTSFPWEDMLKLSMLPKLEVLKLKNFAFSGAIWKSREGGFPHLKYFLISRTNLELWLSEGSHFPSLQHLVLMHCRLLKEIPCGIGEAPLLEKIELHYCSETAATSTKQIQLEQQSFGIDGLTVLITTSEEKLEAEIEL